MTCFPTRYFVWVASRHRSSLMKLYPAPRIVNHANINDFVRKPLRERSAHIIHPSSVPECGSASTGVDRHTLDLFSRRNKEMMPAMAVVEARNRIDAERP